MTDNNTTKTCSRCKRTLDRSMFYAMRAKADGLSPSCKECQNSARNEPLATLKRIAYKREWRLTEAGQVSVKKDNGSNGRLRVDKYRTSAKGIATRKAYETSERGRSASNRAYHNAKTTLHLHYSARKAVARAIAAGRLAPACSIKCHQCDATASQYHHNNGYARENWLDVTALCLGCHLASHDKKLIPK